MTDSAYRPYSLPSEIPPPPRNAGVPDTSIAGTEAQQNWPPSTPWQRQQEQGVSEREGEAQKSKPTAAAVSEVEAEKQPKPATTATSQPAGQKAKKSKLRPRKAPITITPTAVSHLRELLEQPESKLVRVGVKNRGCSGLAYHLEYVDKAGAFDEAVQQDGVQVLIDSKALFSIIGSEMDWLEDKLSARFIFKNPNISKCSCDYRHQTSWILTSAQLSNAVAVNHSAFHETFPRAILNVYIDRTAAFVAFFCVSYIQAFRGKKSCSSWAVPDLEYPRLEINDPHILNNPIQARHEL
jgi:iron-sulfur cluster assembly protein